MLHFQSYQRPIPHIDQYNTEIPCLVDKDSSHKPGLTYCAPVVAAKTLIGRVLAQPEFQMLLPLQGDKSTTDYQSELIEKLAKDMGTSDDINDPNAGTTPLQFIDGLERFLINRGFKFDKPQWSGWGAGEIDSQRESKPITEEELATALANPNRDLTGHVGWYQNPNNGLWSRRNGHFVAGKGFDSDTKLASIQDPSPRSQRETTLVKPEPIADGILSNGDKGTENAKGYLKFNGIKSKIVEGVPTTGILDGSFEFGITRK